MLILFLLFFLSLQHGITSQSLCSFSSNCSVTCDGEQILSTQSKIVVLKATCTLISTSCTVSSPRSGTCSPLSTGVTVGENHYYKFLVTKGDSLGSVDEMKIDPTLMDFTEHSCFPLNVSCGGDGVYNLPCAADSDCNPSVDGFNNTGCATGLVTCSLETNQCTPVFETAGVTCSPGNDANPCRTGVCTGKSVYCDLSEPSVTGSTCFGSENQTDLCNLKGTCNGSSTQCTTLNTPAPNTTVCRPATGACDLDAYCNGSSITCPSSNPFKANTVVCRESTGACDSEEKCTGSSASCPENTLSENGVICRASLGPCDMEERCNGQNASCPPDMKRFSGEPCRDIVEEENSCDMDDFCDGIHDSCPDRVRASGEVCRGANPLFACLGVAKCDGESKVCPSNPIKSAGTLCRGIQGLCDVEEYCTGESGSCPSDVVLANNTFCASARGDCELDMLCNGISPACPSSNLKPETEICRNSSGSCDVIEYCTGTSPECPIQSYQPSTTVCREAAGVCDKIEYCTGNGPTCPSEDEFYANETKCRSATDACDEDEYCDGISANCPPDLRRDMAYGFKCGTTAYFCGIEYLNELTFRKAMTSFGTLNIGNVDMVLLLKWPDCKQGCLPKECPNELSMTVYVEGSCVGVTNTTRTWLGTQKIEVISSTPFPICPTNNTNSSLVNFEGIVRAQSSNSEHFSGNIIALIILFIVLTFF